MKKVVLVDMENMHREGYSTIPPCSEFEFVFFESEYTVEIPYYVQQILQERKIDYSFEWVERSPNRKDTMDFQMVAYLALRSRLAQMGTEEYYILSKDSDFNLPSKYISQKSGVDIYVIKTLNTFINHEEMTESRRLTVDYIIDSCIEKAKSKQELHCLLQKTLKQFYNQCDITDIYYDSVSRFKEKKVI